MQLIESIDSLADDVYPRFCIPPKSSMPEVHRDVYRYSCSKAMDFSEDDKMEWADSIKLWNEGMLSVVKKTDDMIETAQLVADVLGNWAGRWSWDWRLTEGWIYHKLFGCAWSCHLSFKTRQPDHSAWEPPSGKNLRVRLRNGLFFRGLARQNAHSIPVSFWRMRWQCELWSSVTHWGTREN